MIKERLVQYLDNKGITKYAFYKKTGFSNGFLDKEGSIGSDKCEKIISLFPDIDIKWLITGQAPVEYNIASEPIVHYGRESKKKDGQRIPLYNIEAAAGVVKLFRDNHPTKEFITIPNLPKSDGALYISGDSMYPLLKSGDIVIYKQVHDIPNCIFMWGEMYLISFQNGGDDYSTVKYIQRSDEGKTHIKLVSQNSNHQPIDIPISSIGALALVKASIRINAMN